MVDTLITNGLVFDGLGSEPIHADLAIKNGRIHMVGPDLKHLQSRHTINAQGFWVCPGFIDIHTHYDLEVEIAPALSESVRHGVTSVVMGNCSLSVTMGEPQNLADIFQRVETLSPVLIRKWLQRSMMWKTPSGYMEHLDQLPLGPSVAPLLGHSALRAQAMGLERSLTEKASARDMRQMRRLASEALDAGCVGISIDMVPWHMMTGPFRGRTIPSQHASFKEYAMLADLCRERDKVFQVTPNPQRFFSVVEIFWMSLGIWRKPLRMTILSALDSVAYRSLWRLFDLLLFFFNRLLGCNIRFQTLTEPFTVFSDGPITPVFEEFKTGVELNDRQSSEERKVLWQTPGFRKRFKEDWLGGPLKTFHCDLASMKIVGCPEKTFEQKTFAQAAAELQKSPIDFFMDCLAQYDTQIRWVATGANDRLEPRLKLMAHPHILPGFTDAGAHVQNLGYYDGAISLLRQAVQTRFMTPAKAIARVSGEAARWFQLDTGIIKAGRRADITVVDPAGLKDPIAAQVCIQDPLLDDSIRMVKRGSQNVIKNVFIHGIPVVNDGEPLPVLGTTKLGERLEAKPTPVPVYSKDEMRNAINRHLVDHPFTDYWKIFLLKHQNPWNVRFHIAGVVIFYGVLAAALVWRNPWILLLTFLSQLVGLLGHLFFERSHIDTQDAVFSTRASRSLNKMFFYIVCGRYWSEVKAAQAELNTYRMQQLPKEMTFEKAIPENAPAC